MSAPSPLAEMLGLDPTCFRDIVSLVRNIVRGSEVTGRLDSNILRQYAEAVVLNKPLPTTSTSGAVKVCDIELTDELEEAKAACSAKATLERIACVMDRIKRGKERKGLRLDKPLRHVFGVCYTYSNIQKIERTLNTVLNLLKSDEEKTALLLALLYYYAVGADNAEIARRGRWLVELLMTTATNKLGREAFLSTCPSKEDAALILYYMIINDLVDECGQVKLTDPTAFARALKNLFAFF